MNYRFYNARILTMEENRPIFTGEVRINGRRIVYVGETNNTIGNTAGPHAVNMAAANEKPRPHLDLAAWDREIDCRGNLLMPGFKNAHTHSGMTLLRSRADDMPLSLWLEQQVFPVEDRMTAEDVYHLTRLAILEYLSGGITAIFEMYLTPETIAAACADTGMRCVQTAGTNDFSQTTPERLAEYYRTINGQDQLNSFRLGFHAEYTCSEDLLREVAALAHELKAPVYTHLAETTAEVAGCRARHRDQTPAVYLDSLGMFDYGGGGFHCVHMSADDLTIFQQKGLYAITNPASNLKLASGIAPIAECLRRGIPVAIGTDGPASNNCLDMFREMFLVTGLAKVRENDASAVAAREVLKMACVDGARCMGLTESVSLAPGQLADMIMLDLQQPNMQPLNNPAVNIVYSGSKQNILMTMINGKILYDCDGFHVGEDAAGIYEKVNKIAERIYK